MGHIIVHGPYIVVEVFDNAVATKTISNQETTCVKGLPTKSFPLHTWFLEIESNKYANFLNSTYPNRLHQQPEAGAVVIT